MKKLNPLKKNIFTLSALFFTYCFALGSIAFAQEEIPKLTLEDIFASAKFAAQGIPQGQWAEKGPTLYYIEADSSSVVHLISYDHAREKETTIIDGNNLHAADVDRLITIQGYVFNHDHSSALIYTDSAPVWRLNTKGYYYIFDLQNETLIPLGSRDKGYQMFAKFSPDGKYVAFVRNRNLYLVDLANMLEIELTSNGSEGAIINGTSDWVYEEELNLRDGWCWSPDSKYIAFYQFDESNVSEFYMVDLRGKRPRDIRYKFPRAGESNSEVRIGVIDIETKDISFFNTGTWHSEEDVFEYIPRMGWTPKIDGQHLVWIIRLNRAQNHADLIYGNPTDSSIRFVLEEKSDTWLEVVNFFDNSPNLYFLEKEDNFIWLSERDGFKHIYLYKQDGKLVRQITAGQWEISQLHGIDEDSGVIYFSANVENPTQNQLYVTKLKSKNETKPRKITSKAGTHTINFSNDYKYFIDTYSSINTPPVISLYKYNGSLLKVLEDNTDLLLTIAEYQLPRFEFMTVKAADDSTTLYASLLKPTDFDPDKQYSLLIDTYGGPGVQQVQNIWGGASTLWQYYLAEEYDILIASIDNRGAAGYGKSFANALYKNLGTVEPQDQIAAAKQLGDLPYVDKNRIGIWGGSYGGYNTLLSMLKYDGPTTIKLGVALSPGVNFELYDTIYTERYMLTPELNEAGYKEANVINFVNNLQDHQKLLTIHGDLDDNAHYQGAVQLVAALQRANKHFQFMVYPGANHSYMGTGNPYIWLHLFTTITNFITTNL